MESINKIVKGYGNIIKSCSNSILTTFKIFLFLIFVFIISILIVYPLWFLATTSPSNYTTLVMIATLVLFGSYLIYKFFASVKDIGLKRTLFEVYFAKIKKILFFLVLLFLILFTIYLYTYSLLIGIILTILIFLFFGYAKFVYKN